MHAGKNQFYGLAIGFVVVAGGYGAGHISGGCFNPAVAIGIDVSSAGLGFGWCIPYTIFEFVGAALAAVLFQVCRPEEKDDEVTEAPAAYELPSKVLSEFLGTYFLVLTVGLNVLGGSKAPVWSIAASLMCMIFALGTCSGAHFNPAVTIAIVAAGRDKCSPKDAGIYIGVQIVAGIAAAFTYTAMEGKSFPLGPGKGYGWAEAAVAEIMFTFLLAFVVLSVATVQSPLSEYFGLAIGSCVTAGGYAIGAVSGGSLNPAVSFGIGVSGTLAGGNAINCLIYSVFEIIGGLIAAGVFMATHPSEYAKGEGSAEEAAAVTEQPSA
jgi:aquaporin Z